MRRGLILAVLLGLGCLVIVIAMARRGGGEQSAVKPVPAPRIRIVAVVPLTGPASAVGKQIEAGIRAAAASLPDCDITFEDSKASPTEAATIVRRQLAAASATPTGFVIALSAVAKATVPATVDAKCPTVLTCVATPDVVKGADWCYQLYWTTRDFLPLVAKHLKAHRTIAVVTSEDEYGKACAAELALHLPADSVVMNDTFPLRGGDVSTLAQKIGGTDATAVFVGGYGSNFESLLQRLKAVAPDKQVYTAMDLGDPETRMRLGSGAIGAIAPVILPDYETEGPAAPLRNSVESQSGKKAYMGVAMPAHDAVYRVRHALRNRTVPSTQPTEGELSRLLPPNPFVLVKIGPSGEITPVEAATPPVQQPNR